MPCGNRARFIIKSYYYFIVIITRILRYKRTIDNNDDKKDVLGGIYDAPVPFEMASWRAAADPVPKEPNLTLNPFKERSPFHESNPGPSTYYPPTYHHQNLLDPSCAACKVHQKNPTKARGKNATVVSSDYNNELPAMGEFQ